MKVTRVIAAIGRGEEVGQALAEYALILSFVSIVAVAVLTTLGGDLRSLITSVSHAF